MRRGSCSDVMFREMMHTDTAHFDDCIYLSEIRLSTASFTNGLFE
jgi:hypothetical protein